jgi:hypothetical protein
MKLSKAQERTLERIRSQYQKELQDGKQYYVEHLENPRDDDWRKYYQEHLDMYEKGFVLWGSTNSRTLEILAEAGFIEYIKKERWGGSPIDWVKLKETEEA